MGEIFSASEIVRMGIEIEKNGRDFYNSLMRKARDIKVQEVFNFLAKEEENHIRVFQKILEKSEKGEETGIIADDYYAYMRSLADNYVFTKENTGGKAAASIKSEKEGVEKAINFERESIIFYDGIKKTVPEADKAVVDSLIEQENRHLEQLIELKEQI
jgi:rubrerythrin